MGLDMYLRANRHQNTDIADNLKSSIPEIEDFEINDISIEVAYWRKANQIHSWFVKNVQDNCDDCGDYWVSREQLEELLNLCKEVVKNKENPETHLPTQSGFFFGNTEYDDWYFKQIEYTIGKLEKALTLPDTWTFSYYSSW